MTEQVVVAIEAVYIDLREPFAADRVDHIRDALALKDLVQSRLVARARFHLLAFINDISLPADLTDSGEVRNGAPSSTNGGLLHSIQEITRFQLHQAGYDGDDIHPFHMRATRNRATKTIKRGLKEGRRPYGIGIVESDQTVRS